MRRSHSIVLSIAFLSPLAVSNRALAGMIATGPTQGQVPTFTFTVESATGSWQHQPSASQFGAGDTKDGGGYEMTAPEQFNGVLGGRANVGIQEVQFDPDPFVLNNVLVTNTTATTQVFSIFVGLPTSFGAPNLISGNVRTDVIDGGGASGATLASVAPSPIYAAQIDFTNVATLQDHPFSITAAPTGSASASASFGPTVNAIPVTSNIGIQLRFSLTPGDTASILSRFDVVEVPEPASLTTLATAGTLLVRRRRQ